MICRDCPRRCGAERTAETGRGFCGVGLDPVIARAALHHWEEPCISGTRGAGAVFFSGCSLRCVFCQNHDISAGQTGERVSVRRLREIMETLVAQGAHNIDLVTPTHFARAVGAALAEPLPVPVVWNSGGYDRVETLRRLEGKVQIYMPDLKYSDAALAGRLSAATDYPRRAAEALREMFRQTGPYRMGEDGLLQSGLLVRHLILPGELENTFGALDMLAELFRPGDILVSLMSQYTPMGAGPDRRVTPEEYARAEDYMRALGLLDGYTQSPDSADTDYIPAFDGTGVSYSQ